MYDEKLADKIVEYLNSAFPDLVQLDDLKQALPDSSGVSEEDWLKTLDALGRDSRVEFKGLRTGIDNKLQAAANIVISGYERRRLAGLAAANASAGPRVQTAPPVQSDPDRAKHVWVVHGRDSKSRTAMFTFLLALGLKPVSFGRARELTDKAMPHISEILTTAFEHAQAVVVLLTPDDQGRLRPEFVKTDDEPSDTELTPQPRLNVIFEAGMAAVSHPEQTIFVKFGYVRPFSDVAGLHYVAMDDSVEQRRELALRLKSAGCPVNLDDVHWMRAGDFAPPQIGSGKKLIDDALKNEITAYVSSLQMEWEAQKKKRPLTLKPLFEIVDFACGVLLDLHTKALVQGAQETAAKLADAYQALKRYEGAESTASMDFDDLAFVTDVDDALARVKSAVGQAVL